MIDLLELNADEPVERLQAQGIAAVVFTEDNAINVGLDSHAARALGQRLIELAEQHEQHHKRERQ